MEVGMLIHAEMFEVGTYAAAIRVVQCYILPTTFLPVASPLSLAAECLADQKRS